MSQLTTTEHSPRNSSPPPRSLNRQVVLEEDEYTAALSHIIARDFFPSLVHLDATNNYLDALRSEDPQLIDATVRHLQELATPVLGSSTRAYQPHQTPSQTPWAAGPSDTPSHAPPEGGEPPQKRPRYDTNMSLDEFQARYTSEDNSSFVQILDDENRVRRDKYGWAWEAQRRVEQQRDRMLEARERMLIEPPPAPGIREKRVIEAPKPVGLIADVSNGDDKLIERGIEGNDGRGEKQNTQNQEVSLVSRPPAQGDEKGGQDVMAPKKDTRPAGVDGWKFKARNALMFSPDADVAPHAVTAMPPPPARGDPKSIKYGNTRLPEQNESSSGVSEPPSPTRSRIDAAIAGTPYRPRSPSNEGFSLVQSIPSPKASELGPAAVKELMTWGKLNATPRILSSEDPAESKLPPASTPFHIPAPTAREEMGHRLSNKAVKSLREKAALMGGGSSGLGFRTPSSSRGSMPPPSSTPRRAEAAGSLTPAAKRLLDRSTMGSAAARRAEAMGKAAGWESSKAKEKDLNKVRWTPSPAITGRKR